MTVFLDACILIYWLELKEPYYSQFIKQLEHLNDLYPNAQIAVSRLSVLECCVDPLKKKNKQLLNAYDQFFSDPAINMIELSADVITSATKLRASTSIKTPDVIQAACALNCESLAAFVTNDKSFTKIDSLPTYLL